MCKGKKREKWGQWVTAVTVKSTKLRANMDLRWCTHRAHGKAPHLGVLLQVHTVLASQQKKKCAEKNLHQETPWVLSSIIGILFAQISHCNHIHITTLISSKLTQQKGMHMQCIYLNYKSFKYLTLDLSNRTMISNLVSHMAERLLAKWDLGSLAKFPGSSFQSVSLMFAFSLVKNGLETKHTQAVFRADF